MRFSGRVRNAAPRVAWNTAELAARCPCASSSARITWRSRSHSRSSEATQARACCASLKACAWRVGAPSGSRTTALDKPRAGRCRWPRSAAGCAGSRPGARRSSCAARFGPRADRPGRQPCERGSEEWHGGPPASGETAVVPALPGAISVCRAEVAPSSPLPSLAFPAAWARLT